MLTDQEKWLVAAAYTKGFRLGRTHYIEDHVDLATAFAKILPDPGPNDELGKEAAAEIDGWLGGAGWRAEGYELPRQRGN